MPDLDDLDPNFHSALNRLIAASGGQITVNSAYRDIPLQTKLWNQALQKYGSPEAARQWVAPPGHSNHNRGLAADLGFSGQGLQWAHQHAGEYGLTFPLGNENWHIEPAGLRNKSAFTNPPSSPSIGNNMPPPTSGLTARKSVAPPPLSPTADLQRQLTQQLSGALQSPPVNPWNQSSPELARALGLDLAPAQTPPNSDPNSFLPPVLQSAPVGPLAGLTPAPQPAASTRLQLAADRLPTISSKPTQFDTAALNAQAQQAENAARLDFLNTHPAPAATWNPVTAGPYPTFALPDSPTRPAPRQDLASTLIGGLAGIIDPIGAGHYSAAPIQAGIQVANQEYGDRQQAYAQAVQRAIEQHQNDVNAHNEALRLATTNAEMQHNADLINRTEEIRRLGQVGDLTAATAGGDVLLPGLGGLADRDHAATLGAEQQGLISTDANAERQQQTAEQQRQAHLMGLVENLTRTDANAAIRQAAIAETARQHDMLGDPNDPRNVARLQTAGAAGVRAEAAQSTAAAANVRAGAYAQGVDNRGQMQSWRMQGSPLAGGGTAAVNYPQGYVPGQGHAPSSHAAPDLLAQAERGPDISTWKSSIASLRKQRNRLIANGQDTGAVDRELVAQNGKLQQARATSYAHFGLNPDGSPQAPAPAQLTPSRATVAHPAPGTPVPLPAGVGGLHTAPPDPKKRPAPAGNAPIIRGNGFTLTPKG